jgi:hypothetical protein
MSAFIKISSENISNWFFFFVSLLSDLSHKGPGYEKIIYSL